jgi:polysaccharide biosynthesis protein PslH
MDATRQPCHRFLFVKHTLAFPRAAGHDIRCYEMMRALTGLGHVVALATVTPAPPEALKGLPLDRVATLPGVTSNGVHYDATRLQQRFASYWGASPAAVVEVAQMAQSFKADVVVGVGLDVLPYLVAVQNAKRVWYAGDEWASHHLSLVRPFEPATWSEVRTAIVKGLYERAHAPLIDRAWVVAAHEVRPMKRYGGMKSVDVVTNGVDVDHYLPAPGAEQPHSLVFWGRLDFEPNIDAVTWLCREVWPRLRQRVPDATCRLVGFKPVPQVLALGGDGVTIADKVADIRPEVARSEVVVLPFWSGGGIKNKLLEALAMGKPVICTVQAVRGLRGDPPVAIAESAADWVDRICALWQDDETRHKLGRDAREWVVERHTWRAAAFEALRSLETSEAS